MKKHKLRGSVTLLLLALLALNLLLYREVRRWYRNFNRVRLDPLALGAFPHREVPVARDRPLVVFFGDSRAAAWTAPALDAFTFVNRGVNGHTTAQSLLRYDAHVAPLQPDIVVLQVGINDLVGLPLLAEQQAKIVADAQGNIEEIVNRARADGAVVVLTTVFPTGAVPLHRYPFWSPTVDAAIARVNAHLRSLADADVLLFETAPILTAGEEKVKAAFAADYLHLNEKGYAALNGPLAELLAPLGTP